MTVEYYRCDEYNIDGNTHKGTMVRCTEEVTALKSAILDLANACDNAAKLKYRFEGVICAQALINHEDLIEKLKQGKLV